MTTQYLSRVRIHFWTSGRIVQLVPKRQEIVEPNFRGGLVPAHFHLEPAATGAEQPQPENTE